MGVNVMILDLRFQALVPKGPGRHLSLVVVKFGQAVLLVQHSVHVVDQLLIQGATLGQDPANKPIHGEQQVGVSR